MSVLNLKYLSSLDSYYSTFYYEGIGFINSRKYKRLTASLLKIGCINNKIVKLLGPMHIFHLFDNFYLLT